VPGMPLMAGRWFVTFHVDVDVADPVPLPASGQNVGVDVGLAHFAALSTGEKIAQLQGGEDVKIRPY
jgi:transposase